MFCVAIKLAEKLSGLLHRDVSLGNVMIKITNGKVSGILADWDHAGKVESIEGEAHQNFRTVCFLLICCIYCL